MKFSASHHYLSNYPLTNVHITFEPFLHMCFSVCEASHLKHPRLNAGPCSIFVEVRVFQSEIVSECKQENEDEQELLVVHVTYVQVIEELHTQSRKPLLSTILIMHYPMMTDDDR